MTEPTPEVGFYRHFKGGLYVVTDSTLAVNKSGDDEQMVSYMEADHGGWFNERERYLREVAEFMGNVAIDGQEVRRFFPLGKELHMDWELPYIDFGQLIDEVMAGEYVDDSSVEILFGASGDAHFIDLLPHYMLVDKVRLIPVYPEEDDLLELLFDIARSEVDGDSQRTILKLIEEASLRGMDDIQYLGGATKKRMHDWLFHVEKRIAACTGDSNFFHDSLLSIGKKGAAYVIGATVFDPEVHGREPLAHLLEPVRLCHDCRGESLDLAFVLRYPREFLSHFGYHRNRDFDDQETLG